MYCDCVDGYWLTMPKLDCREALHLELHKLKSAHHSRALLFAHSAASLSPSRSNASLCWSTRNLPFPLAQAPARSAPTMLGDTRCVVRLASVWLSRLHTRDGKWWGSPVLSADLHDNKTSILSSLLAQDRAVPRTLFLMPKVSLRKCILNRASDMVTNATSTHPHLISIPGVHTVLIG